MKTALHAVALASLLSLCACASVDTTPAADPAPANQPQNVAKAADNDNSITGSRLPGKRTDRLVKTVGSQDYKDSKDAQARPLNSQ
jgi:uncharacterized membrane protein